MAKPEGLEVQIVSRTEIPFPGEAGQTRYEVWTTYRYGRMPPGVVRIPKEKWTLEEEKKAIKADIEARTRAKPEVVRI